MIATATILDYLEQFGGVSFADSPFNEVDSYIISKIGTPDFSGIVPEDAGSIAIAEAAGEYVRRRGEAGNYLGLLASPHIVPVIRRLPDTVRYGSLLLSGYVRRDDRENTEQFSALTVTLPDGRHYVSFRGTDDTLTGWKENFLMSVEKEVPAQRDAAEYLSWAGGAFPGDMIVGGHSKGGNLAIYASARAAAELQERIRAVYNYDGPGFHPEFLETEGYLRVRPRILTFLPQFSIVGTLLTQDGFDIVKSSRAGAAAHDGFNWEVSGAAFVRCDSLSRGSLAFEDSMTAELEKMDADTRRACIDELFGAFAAAGAVTLTDMTQSRLRRALLFINSLRRAGDSRRFAADILESMLKKMLLSGSK